MNENHLSSFVLQRSWIEYVNMHNGKLGGHDALKGVLNYLVQISGPSPSAI